MTCTVTMPSDTALGIRPVSGAELRFADYQFKTPFTIQLDQGDFTAQAIVRLIPGRRMVVFGLWDGMPAVAKLFFHRKHAVRHLAQDVKGIKLMQEYKIPTPRVRYEGVAEDNATHVLVLDKIQPGISLETLWMERESDEIVLPALHAVMVELATQHVLGVVQRDMHLGNFLISGRIIYTLDGAQISVAPTLLPKKESIENTAWLLSQLGAGVSALQHGLFLHYARARGWLLKPDDTREMQFQIKKCDVTRWKHFEKKIFRASTDFTPVRRFGWRGMVRRDSFGCEMRDFMLNPDSAFARKNRVMLKDGRSSTVIKVTLDGQELVIKRYNMKSIWHRLRRLLRMTRAQHSWRLAQKLQLFNVNTAAPVAYLESNVFGLRGKSYFIMKYIAGSDVKEYLAPFEQQPYAAANVIQRVCNLLASLTQLEVTHGDLKATNIIVDSEGRPHLIDLDGAREHFSASGLQKAWLQEMKRFMQNFTELPAMSDILRRTIRSDHLK